MQKGNPNSARMELEKGLSGRTPQSQSARKPNQPQDFPTEPFRPRRRLTGGHAQTLVGNFLPRRNQLPPAEERLFRVEHNVQVLCHCHWQADRRNAMTMVIVHGLEGSSESQYVIGTGSKAWCAGMNVVRMNMRNCGGTEQLGPTLYNCNMSGDVGAVVQALIEQDGLRKLGLAGFSMGGNLVLKQLGEWGERAPSQVKAAIAISAAIDLAASVDTLHDNVNRLYELKFVWSLRRRLQRKAALYPGQYDVRYLQGVWDVRTFDDRITARYCGFRDAEDYYTRAASARVVDSIVLPTLVIHAQDDPFMRILAGTRDKLMCNPHVTYVETEHGGHCAFLAEPNGYDGRWAERQAVAFLRQIEIGNSVT